jgi:glycerophosphoryl diester phosphodiesterase
MSLSRRDFAVLAAAGVAAQSWVGPAFADVAAAAIVAEGGAAEERIEDTRSALDLAINQGCDFVQVNLVASKEGALVARRDNELSAGTNVASRPDFADRKTTKTIDGAEVTGWFAEDFTLAELQSLFCREAHPELRPQNVKLDGKEPLLTLGDALQIARAGCVRTARTVGVCARIIHSGWYDSQGLDVIGRLASDLGTAGYASPAAAVWVQASEPDALRAFGKLSRVRRMQLIEPADGAQMTTSASLGDIHVYAEAIGPHQDLLLDPTAAMFPAPTTLALDAHNAGLKVFSRTVRPQNQFLPPALRRGDKRAASSPSQRGDSDKLLGALFADQLDGVCTDLISDAAKARKGAAEAIAQGRGKRG